MTEQQIMDLVNNLKSEEKAAAISHIMYCLVADEFGWSLKVPRNWSDVDQDTRKFNLASTRKWKDYPKLFRLWVDSIETS